MRTWVTERDLFEVVVKQYEGSNKLRKTADLAEIPKLKLDDTLIDRKIAMNLFNDIFGHDSK